MINPDRIVILAIMVGIVTAGFTWFGWELCENVFTLIGRSRKKKREAAEDRERVRREAAERETREREAKEQIGKDQP